MYTCTRLCPPCIHVRVYIRAVCAQEARGEYRSNDHCFSTRRSTNPLNPRQRVRHQDEFVATHGHFSHCLYSICRFKYICSHLNGAFPDNPCAPRRGAAARISVLLLYRRPVRRLLVVDDWRRLCGEKRSDRMSTYRDRVLVAPNWKLGVVLESEDDLRITEFDGS